MNWNSPDSYVSVMSSVLPHYRVEGDGFKDITAMQWSPDGQVIATGCFDGSVRLWNHDGTLRSLLAKHEGPVFAVRWSKNGNFLLSGGSDRIVNVWDSSTFTLIKMHSLHAAQVVDVDWSDSDMFASCSSDRIIHICKVSLPGSGALTSFVGHSNEINMIKWSPNGILLASASDDGTAKVWSVEQGLVHDLKGHLREVFCLAWASNSALCTASFDGTAKVMRFEL
jgi:transducin (beta)-like 1